MVNHPNRKKATKTALIESGATTTATETFAYKAFGPDWKCRDFQFEVGKTYEHIGRVVTCQSGFHACENPFDTWSYYDPFDAKFAKVSLSGELSRHGEDTKIASAKISIVAELTLPEFIRSGIEWVKAACAAEPSSSGDYAKNASSGYYAKNEASGKNSVIAAAGRNSLAKGADGLWIALAEYGADGTCIGFATGCIGEKGLLADVWYKAEGGKLTRA